MTLMIAIKLEIRIQKSFVCHPKTEIIVLIMNYHHVEHSKRIVLDFKVNGVYVIGIIILVILSILDIAMLYLMKNYV